MKQIYFWRYILKLEFDFYIIIELYFINYLIKFYEKL